MEIIQNAEDATADELTFIIDKEQNKITISNNGKEFSLDGYASLLYPDLSSKPQGVFIGQKGLGFRALINWAEEISIISNDLRVTFSEELSGKLLNELKHKRNDLTHITKMQFLSIPDVKELFSKTKGVTLELLCRDNIDFEKQFREIDEECLFFLNNLKIIKTPISTIKKESLDKLIIEEKTSELPEEYYEKEELENKEKRKIFYTIKLIWNPEKDYSDFPLYCYFKTRVKIGSPILIHAGFDLSDDRNSIEQTDRNLFLVHEICNSIENLLNKITQKYKDWSAYKIVNHDIQCQRDSIFENLKECFNRAKKYMPIYPTIDGELKALNEIIVLNNEITEFIISLKENYKNISFYEFDNVVQPFNNYEIDLYPQYQEYYRVFNILSKKIPVNDINRRCELIKLFYSYAKNHCKTKPALFIDNNNEIIPGDAEVFYNLDEEFDSNLIPAFCKYRTINSKLNRKLLNEKILSNEEIRECINNFYPFDITNLFLMLIDYLQTNITEKQNNEIYLNLFNIYKKYENQINIIDNYKNRIPFFCEDGKYYSENVIFNYGYNTNDEILDVIGDLLKYNSEVHFIAKKDYWSFLGVSDVELRSFFKFLGVSDTIDYELLTPQAELFVEKMEKEDLVILAILDYNFSDFLKLENNITRTIKLNNLFSDYVINTKKINFLNKGLLDINKIKKYTNDENKINNILRVLGAQETIETISEQRFNVIIKNLYKWDPDGEFAGRIYDQSLKNEVKIKGDTLYYSKDRSAYLKNKELYYYDNKCLPTSKLSGFPTIDLGRRKGHSKVSDLFNIKSIETYKIKIIGKPDIDNNLTTIFATDLNRFYHLILAYRFCSSTSPLSDEMKREQANALKNIDIKICKSLEYTLNNDLNKEELYDFDFINADGIFYFKVPQNYKNINDIRKHKKELYDFISEMLLMTFKLTENNSYIKDTAVQTYIFDDLNFSVSRFEDDNDRTILRDAEDYLDVINYREEFWKYIWEIKKIDEPYDTWEQKQNTKKTFSTLDYTIYNEDMAAIFKEDDVLVDEKEFFKDYLYRTSINFWEYNLEKFTDVYNRVKNDIEKYVWYQCNKKKDNQTKYLDRIRAIHWDNGISELFYSHNFYVRDFEKELWKKLKENNFDKDKIYEIINSNKINEEEIFQNNCSKYTKEQLDIIEQRYDMRSLLYFDNTEDTIREFLENHEKNQTLNIAKQLNSDELNNENFEWKKLEIIPSNKPNVVKITDTAKNKRTSYSSIEQTVNDIIKGKNIEQIAMEFLNNSKKFTKIKNVSTMGLGYDIECKEIRTNKTLYIEVKSFEKDYFELTENEYNVWDNNKKIYKILLIKINMETKTIYEELIDGEELKNIFNIETSKYRCKRK